jgi:hypothetical protein
MRTTTWSRATISAATQPADMFWDQQGTGNKVIGNDCQTAIPGNLGWCTGK